MDKYECKQIQMSYTSRFGKLVHVVVDYATKGPFTKKITNLGRIRDGGIQGRVRAQEILINQVLIHEQLGISKEGARMLQLQHLMKQKLL